MVEEHLRWCEAALCHHSAHWVDRSPLRVAHHNEIYKEAVLEFERGTIKGGVMLDKGLTNLFILLFI